MKCIWMILLLFVIACSDIDQSIQPAEIPSDSTVDRLIRGKYTGENQLDGGEFATVDSLVVERSSQIGTTTRVVYFIHCSFQKAVRAPGYDAGIRPPIHQRDSIDIKKEGESWVMIGE